MGSFFILEGGNLTIALFFILIAIFVSTREFIDKKARRFILFATIFGFLLLIMGHFIITTKRMDGVKKAFSEGKEVICENRLHRKAAQSIKIAKERGWSLDGDNFVNPIYNRPFHSSRCIEPDN